LIVWPSRFIEELPEKFLEKNSFFDENDENDFEFNQDFDFNDENNNRSPGWARYQKRIK
jgi:DNA helicase-2/ATP-dependent DNA helicase PcrA